MNDKYNVVQEWLYKHKLENKIRKFYSKLAGLACMFDDYLWKSYVYRTTSS